MTMLRIAVVSLLAVLVLGQPRAVAEGLAPFESSPQVVAADDGEVVVVWRERRGTRLALRAAIGRPGRSFGAAATIARTSAHPTVLGDAAGNVVVLWEDILPGPCPKADCGNDSSLGVFAALRPAGGSFRAPVRLSGPQSVPAAPRMAMNRSGDWVVVMARAADTVVAGAKGAAAPPVWQPLRASGLASVFAVGLDEAGNATLAGLDADRHPATVVRTVDGSIGELTVLDDAELYGGPRLAVGPRGDAVALWRASGVLRNAARPAGGSFGAATSSSAPAGSSPTGAAIDRQGRTVIVFSGSASSQPPAVQVARGTIQAPFGDTVTVSDPARFASPAALSTSSDGDAVLLWPDIVLGGPFVAARDPAWQGVLAIDGGPFSAPRRLASAANERIGGADAAIDATGRVVLTWIGLFDFGIPNDLDGDVHRIYASSLSPQGAVAGPTVIAEQSLGDLRARASAARAQVLRIRRDATIRPLLRCVSPTTFACRGTVRIDAPAPGGHERVPVGSARFVYRAGSSRRLRVRASRAARRAVRRGSLRCTIVVRTQAPDGGWLKTTTTLTLRRRGS